MIKKRHPKKTFTVVAALLTATLGYTMPTFASDSDQQPPIAELGFVNIDKFPLLDGKVNNIRAQALRETATTLGAQGALAWRSIHMDTALEQQTSYLDHVFDFNRLLLNNNVLPPILEESQDDLNLADDSTIRMDNQTYKIVAPARFVTAAPTWRDYLWMSYQKPDVPDQTLLPVNTAEAKIWNFYLQQGWEEGLTQANEIFAANLSRLKRDYLGIILYRKLLSQGIISSPTVATADLGVTGNADELRIKDEVMRITAKSALQPDSNQWKPVLTQ